MGGSGGGNVNADLPSIRDYAKDMALKMPATGLPDVMSGLAQTAPLVREAFQSNTALAAGVFQEGTVVADLMTQYLNDFKSFTMDVTKGLRAIGNAAGVVAEIYQNADGSSAVSIGDVAFAFADPNAQRPAGLPKDLATTTLSEADAKARGNNPVSMATMGNTDLASGVYYPASGVAVIMFPDGSSQQIVRKYDSGSMYAGYTTETIYYSPTGQREQRTVQTTGTSTGGYQIDSTTVEMGGGSTTTSTTHNPDGSLTVTTTTTGPDGKQSDPHTTVVAADTHRPTVDAGPIQTAEQQYDTKGDENTVKKLGGGY